MTAPELAAMSDRLAQGDGARGGWPDATGHPYAVRRDTAR
jgi:hypothetical protein